jgi:hypothetical protein
LVIYFVQDPYKYQFDYLKTKKNLFCLPKKPNLRLRLSISKRGCSIPTTDRIRLLLKLSDCKYGNGCKSNDDNSLESSLSVNKNFKRFNEFIIRRRLFDKSIKRK